MRQVLMNSEEDLLLALKEGDEAALEMVYKTHYPMIIRLIQNNSGSREDAQDIYQEAMIILYEKLNQDGFVLKCQVKTFLYSVCRRQWLKRLSERKILSLRPEKDEELAEVNEEVKDFEESEARFENMGKALERLGEPCRTLIEDFYIRKLSMEEIADKFGYTNADNAKNQKYKCLKRLKTLFFSNHHQ